MSDESNTQIHEPQDGDDVRVTHPAAAEDGVRELSRSRGTQIRNLAARFGVVIALALMIAFFCILLGGKFASWDNARNIINEQAILGILALAVIIPLTVGEFDLSIAANLGLTALLTAYLAKHGVAPGLLLPIAILTGMLIGAVNAGLVRFGINAFIATLGISTILSGFNLLITQGTLIRAGSDTLKDIATTKVANLNLSVFYFLALILVMYYLFEWTSVGRYLRATGFGREAARLTGVRTQFWLPVAFIAAGAIAGFAGFLHTATYQTVPPTTGPEYLLPAYAAAFLGATTILRGFFNVWGTVVGIYLLAIGTTGLALAGAPFWVQPIFNGTALVAAVGFAVLADRQKRVRT